MKHWIIGIVLAVIAVALLYGASATSQSAPLGSLVMLLASVVVVLGIFVTIYRGTRHRIPSAAGAKAVPPVGDPAPWAGTGRTLGVSLVGVAALLVYVGIYVGAWANVVAWIIPVFVGLTVVILGTLVVLTAGKTD